MARIAVIDDHRLFATGVASVLEELGEVRCFDQPTAALTSLNGWRADLVLLDFYMPGETLADTLPKLLALGVRVVVISASLSAADRDASLAAGARAFIPKHVAPETLVETCRAVLEDRRIAAPQTPVASPAERLGLTERQLDVLVLLGHGYSNREIAGLLSIGAETVKTHISALFGRLGASNRTEAISMARDNGLL